MTNRSPLNCRLEIRLNGVFLRNNLIKQYFLSAWTPLPLKSKNRISIVAIGARNELQIDHLSLEAGIPLFPLDPREIVVLKTGVFSGSLDLNYPVCAKVFITDKNSFNSGRSR